MEKKKRNGNRNYKEFVVDSSIVAKWFLNEEGTDIAITIRVKFATNQTKLSVPTLLFYEVMNALRFSGSFREGDLDIIVRSLSDYQFEIWRPVGRLLELSTKLSLKEDLTVYDACYIGLALRKGSRVVTEDKELLEKFPQSTLSLDQYKEETMSRFSST